MDFWTKEHYERLNQIVFDGTYPGYRPTVIEAPNGDGAQDTQKRYAHVALKYLHEWCATPFSRYRELYDAFCDAHSLAVAVARELDVPEALRPSIDYSCLRVLEYPPGAGSAPHTDFDLFTLALYRDVWGPFKRHSGVQFEPWACAGFDVHMGEIGELCGLGKALKHEVLALDRTHHSIVYFAIPDHRAVLPNGQNVGYWLSERMARSRY